MFKRIIVILILIGCLVPGVAAVYAEIPRDSFKVLSLQEKEILVSSIYQYQNRLYELNQEILKLRSDKEWIGVKIMRIQDQGRRVPMELKKSRDLLEYKIRIMGIEAGRMKKMSDQHLDNLRKLDDKVKTANQHKRPEWWYFDPWILALMYPGASQASKKTDSPALSSYIQADKKTYQAYGKMSSLLHDLEDKIKVVQLENWVALFAEEGGLRLEVQLPILFGLGKSSVAKDYKQFFRKLSWLLKSYAVKVEVAGYTDSSTINNKEFSSNIELGASRAANVVKELIETGMSPSVFRIVSQGQYGNDQSEKDDLSAAMKRRVEVNVYFKDNEA